MGAVLEPAKKHTHILAIGCGSGETQGQEISQTETFKSVETLLRLDPSEVAVWP
jgi:hypothetical protein